METLPPPLAGAVAASLGPSPGLCMSWVGQHSSSEWTFTAKVFSGQGSDLILFDLLLTTSLEVAVLLFYLSYKWGNQGISSQVTSSRSLGPWLWRGGNRRAV